MRQKVWLAGLDDEAALEARPFGLPVPVRIEEGGLLAGLHPELDHIADLHAAPPECAEEGSLGQTHRSTPVQASGAAAGRERQRAARFDWKFFAFFLPTCLMAEMICLFFETIMVPGTRGLCP